MSGTPNFFLNTICGNIQARLTKHQIYSYYHNRIADKQLEKGKIYKVMFDKIDDLIRQINVQTDDVIEGQIISAKTTMLLELQENIRRDLFTKDAQFLESLQKIFDYNPDE